MKLYIVYLEPAEEILNVFSSESLALDYIHDCVQTQLEVYDNAHEYYDSIHDTPYGMYPDEYSIHERILDDISFHNEELNLMEN